MSEPVYPVFLDAWQFQCCGEKFDVGSEVEWGLVLVAHRVDAEDFRVTLTGEELHVSCGRLVAGPDGSRPRAMRAGGLVAQLPFDGEAPWSGLLFEDHHAEAAPWLPATRGKVVRMAVWGNDLAVNEQGAAALSGMYVTREVDTYPERFSGGTRDASVIRGREGGVLAHLQVM